jgi:hypothetical protein
MDETRRFLRFVIPGLTIIFEGFLFAFLDDKLYFIQEYADFGTALMAFFASGLLGFLFSNVYYAIHWKIYLSKCFKPLRKLDYIKLITDPENKHIFKRFKVDQNISQKEAWTIINTLCNLKYAKKTKSYERKTDTLSNLLTSIGTTFIILSVCWLIGVFYIKSWIIFSLINVVLIFFLACNYVISSSILQHLYEKLFEWLSHEKKRTKSNN